jgi:DNA-binding Lrp family transcriptional regulator
MGVTSNRELARQLGVSETAVRRAEKAGRIRRDRRELSAIANRALALAEQGRLCLVQKRHGDCDYSYIATIARRPPTARRA